MADNDIVPDQIYNADQTALENATREDSLSGESHSYTQQP